MPWKLTEIIICFHSSAPWQDLVSQKSKMFRRAKKHSCLGIITLIVGFRKLGHSGFSFADWLTRCCHNKAWPSQLQNDTKNSFSPKIEIRTLAMEPTIWCGRKESSLRHRLIIFFVLRVLELAACSGVNHTGNHRNQPLQYRS